MVPSQNSQDRPEGPLWGPKAGTLAYAGRRPAYMLVLTNCRLLIANVQQWFPLYICFTELEIRTPDPLFQRLSF